MAGTLIADKVAVARRYVRAVDMARDLRDPTALEGYVLTPSARDALVRIVNGLGRGSSQRAFRVTGPYGSGKSSFGLLLAGVFSDAEAGGHARRLVGSALEGSQVPSYLPAVLVGRRTSLADEILRAIIDSASSPQGWDESVASAATTLLERRQEGPRDVRPVLDLLARYAGDLADRTGGGFLLLIDEMGRYLEFAAANPAHEDPSIFQLLAERAGGASSTPLAVVGFLHHRFGDYVAGLGDWMEGEWARSSERYEEIAFQESTEQTLHLMAQALSPVDTHSAAVRKAAVALYQQASDRQLFTTAGAALRTAAGNLYPLHPAALACLATSSRRFGQNERSVFSFLQSLEPAGFRRFSHESGYGPASWYRLDHLYDYLAAQGSFRFRSTDRERRWQLAVDAVALCAEMPRTHIAVLKALGVMAVLEPVPGLKSDPATIAWCLGVDEEEADEALAALVAKGVAHPRSAHGDYSLWSHTSVDLDRWFEDARLAVPATGRLDAELTALPVPRALIAHRHYHQKGTMRAFTTVIGDKVPPLGGEVDGAVLVMPVHPDEDRDAAAERARAASAAAGPLVLVRQHRIAAADVAQAHDLACWRWVRVNCRELRIDDLARAEVEKRIASLEADLLRLLAPFSDPGREAASQTWYCAGEGIRVRSRAELSRILSDMCDEVFHETPILRNELINRDKLSTAVAAARMRLLHLMITSGGEEYLGLDGAPPERTIYLSLFHASGMHRAAGDTFDFRPPPAEDPKRWEPTWKRIDELVRSGRTMRFDELVAELALAPIGLRAGPALPIIVAYMLHNRRTVALMERNTFQPEVTPAHFMRLAKNPANFALRHVAVQDGDAVLQALAQGLSIWSQDPPEPELKSVVEAFYGWWATLPDFVRNTRSIPKPAQAVRSALRKAREPVELVFETLPDACETRVDGLIDADEFASRLDIAVTQIADAMPTLRRRAAAALLDAFAARSLDELRQQIRLDYQAHVLELADYNLRAFVDRAMNRDLDDAAWLDGVASLVVGHRLDGWDDDTPDTFSFEVRALAQRLARRLALIRESRAQDSPLTAVHLTAPGGVQTSFFVRANAAAPGRAAVADEIRKLLREAADPDTLLVELLAERVVDRQKEKAG